MGTGECHRELETKLDSLQCFVESISCNFEHDLAHIFLFIFALFGQVALAS